MLSTSPSSRCGHTMPPSGARKNSQLRRTAVCRASASSRAIPIDPYTTAPSSRRRCECDAGSCGTTGGLARASADIAATNRSRAAPAVKNTCHGWTFELDGARIASSTDSSIRCRGTGRDKNIRVERRCRIVSSRSNTTREYRLGNVVTMDQPTALQVVDGIDLSGKTCVITGASSGLGRAAARALAAAGAHVIAAARNREALSETVQWIAAEVPGARTSTVQLDLTALSSVRAAAAAISDITPVVEVLMNNAGVMFTPFGRTRDGFELQIGTNHFGHFELTRLLIPELTAAGGARIVVLSSGGHVMGDVDFEDPNWERRDYDKFAAYGASKTA